MVGGTFLCSTCSASFDTNDQRREHMREPWHVFNMRRKVAELPPVSFQLYRNFIEESERPRQSKNVEDAKHQRHQVERSPDSNEEDEDEDEALISQPECCLFCSEVFDDIDENMAHMSRAHGFSIPNTGNLETDVETFLAYLNLVVSRYHSCLHCGQEKQSAEAARSHMMSKGHCMLDLSHDSEFLDFWKSDESAQSISLDDHQRLSENEVRLQSGSVASSRHDGRPSVRQPKSKRQPIESTALVLNPSQDTPDSAPPEPTPSSSKSPSMALAKRDQMGIIGLSDSQRRALAVTQKKLLAREQRSRNEARWVLEKFGNTTKQARFKLSRSGIHSAMQVC